VSPIYYCPRCGGRMSCENVGEWSCYTCGELLFTLQSIDLRVPEIAHLGNELRPVEVSRVTA
jgi:hypothetical protein